MISTTLSAQVLTHVEHRSPVRIGELTTIAAPRRLVGCVIRLDNLGMIHFNRSRGIITLSARGEQALTDLLAYLDIVVNPKRLWPILSVEMPQATPLERYTQQSLFRSHIASQLQKNLWLVPNIAQRHQLARALRRHYPKVTMCEIVGTVKLTVSANADSPVLDELSRTMTAAIKELAKSDDPVLMAKQQLATTSLTLARSANAILTSSHRLSSVKTIRSHILKLKKIIRS